MTSKQAKKTNFLQWNNDIFVNSIKKIDINIILIVILDFLFYVSSGYIITFWLQRVQIKMNSFNIPTDIASIGQESAKLLLKDVKKFYFLLIISVVLLLIAIIFLATILKGIIWAKTLNQKINFALISKFLALNLIWMGFWLILSILISLFVISTSAPLFLIVVIALGVFFSNTLYTIFVREQRLRNIFDALKLNISKIHLFLLPYAFIGLLLFIVVNLSNLLNFPYESIFTGLILLIFAAVVRYYISTLVLEILKEGKPKSL